MHELSALAVAFWLGFVLAPLAHATGGEEPTVVTADGGRYFGPMVEGVRQGHGRIEWPNGASYEGEFSAGLYSGFGRVRMPEGDVYEGEFSNGQLTGQGKAKFSSGETYVGEFRQGLMSGHGRFEDGIGDIYQGEFQRGRYQGIGELAGRTGTYKGEFKEGFFWGKGEIHYTNGRSYSGDFVRGALEGKGRFEYPQGPVYEGEFLADEFSGEGVVTWSDGRRHEGHFKAWRPSGPGKYIDGNGNTYEGNFKDGGISGTARLASTDGTTYIGGIQNWVPHGHGELRLANGDVYTGSFEYGSYEGEGKLVYAEPRPDGNREESGIWRHGRLKKTLDEERRQARLNVEMALYSQATLFKSSLASLSPRRPDSINMFLLAIAGDGSQEVFRREVEFVRQQFDSDFGTRGHSLALINSRTTVGTVPLATTTSIRQALGAIAATMDKERDILFLFVTSHGSKDKELGLGLTGLDLPGLNAAELATMLKEAGIRWKVVVLSACYSGGFIDDLRDPYTLVITAARSDRRSFGCADESNFTYFSRAFFKEALPRATSFQEAFHEAARLVADWEARDAQAQQTTESRVATDKTERYSLPQIEDAPAIEKHLRQWWQTMSRGNSEPVSSAPSGR